jgi:hypothetical protein
MAILEIRTLRAVQPVVAVKVLVVSLAVTDAHFVNLPLYRVGTTA